MKKRISVNDRVQPAHNIVLNFLDTKYYYLSAKRYARYDCKENTGMANSKSRSNVQGVKFPTTLRFIAGNHKISSLTTKSRFLNVMHLIF